MTEQAQTLPDGAINFGNGVIGPSLADQEAVNHQFVEPIEESTNQSVLTTDNSFWLNRIVPKIPRPLLPVLSIGTFALVACAPAGPSNPKVNADKANCRTVDENAATGRQLKESVRAPQSQGYVLVDPRDYVIMVSDRGQQDKIVTGSLLESPFPSLSFDGQRIAYIKDEEVHVIGADGTGDKQVTNLSKEDDQVSLIKTNPAWSPDGKKLAFLTKTVKDKTLFSHGGPSTSVRILDLESNKTEELIEADQISILTMAGVAWSPDGQVIAYAEEYVTDHVIAITYANLSKNKELYFKQRGVGEAPKIPYTVRLQWSQDSKAISYGICPDPTIVQN